MMPDCYLEPVPGLNTGLEYILSLVPERHENFSPPLLLSSLVWGHLTCC